MNLERAQVGVLVSALAAVLAVLPAQRAAAATVANACVESATGLAYPITVTMSATPTPSTVAPGGTLTLGSNSLSMTLTAGPFVAAYNLGLISASSTAAVTISTQFEGTNTVEGTQTGTQPTTVSVTITDPDGFPGTGDEFASPPALNATFPTQTWTAGASGTIDFRENTVTPLEADASPVGGIVITTLLGGFLSVRWACSPGTVASGANPSTIAFTDPAASLASAVIQSGANQAPTANAGADQTVTSGASVSLDGSASSDPDADALTYAWTQTGGTSVTLTGADTATPSFTAPAGPASLAFQLQVCDPSDACDTDSVTITVSGPNLGPTANAGPDQTVASGATVTLDGSASSDPNGDTLEYDWNQTVGPAVSLADGTTATPSFTAPTGPTVLTFVLDICDPYGSCSVDSVTINVSAPSAATADLAVAIAAPAKPINKSKTAVMSILVTNHGPSAAEASLTNQLPSGSQLVSVATSQGSCSSPPVGSTGSMTCTLGSLASGQTATVTVEIRATIKKGTLSDVATVAPVAPTTDPVPANNSATALIQVK